MLLSIQPSRDPQLDNFLPARIAHTISGLRVHLHCLINIVSLLGVSTFDANFLLQNVTKHSHLHEIPQPHCCLCDKHAIHVCSSALVASPTTTSFKTTSEMNEKPIDEQ